MFTNEILSASHRINKLLPFMPVQVVRDEKKRIDIEAVYNQLCAKHCENASAICIGLLASDATRFVTKSVFQKLCDSDKAGYNAIENALRRKNENALIFRNRLESINLICEYPQKAFSVFFSHCSDLLENAETTITSAIYCMPFAKPFSEIDYLYKVACKAVNSVIYDERTYCINVVNDDEKLYNVLVDLHTIFDIAVNADWYDEFMSLFKSMLTDKQLQVYELYMNNGMSARETAKSLNLRSVGSITAHIQLIRQKARTTLDEIGVKINF